jgi:hypothetical protein
MRFDEVPPCEPGGDPVHVVIDTPAGSPNKYKFDEKLGIFRLSRVLPAGLVFPYDFGSVPGTRAADGDPLDVLVLGLPPTFPGCLITARLIGVSLQREALGLGSRIYQETRLFFPSCTLARNLCSSPAGLRQSDGDGLLTALDLFPGAAAAQLPRLTLVHRPLYLLTGFLSVSGHGDLRSTTHLSSAGIGPGVWRTSACGC